MRYSLKFAVVLAALSFATVGAWAQSGSTGGRNTQPQLSARTPQAGLVFVPESSKPKPGLFAHTTYVLRSLDGRTPLVLKSPADFAFAPVAGPDIATTEVLETPASMGCLYVHSPSIVGCVPSFTAGTGGPSAAGYGAIAIVDAYDNPDAAADIANFDSTFGGPLSTVNFTKVYANGNGDCTTPPTNAGWALEEALDIEWSHVFAPKAAIVLVEACSSSDPDLFYAEQVAFNYIVTNFPTTGGQVSNSWQGGEFAGQIADDPLFADFNYNFPAYTSHIVAFASSGDLGFEGGTTGYPSGNPWVVSAGGTSVLRLTSNLHFSSEACWSGAGGGTSSQETYATAYTGGNTGPWADFQYPIFGQGNRATPDMSFNADPASGVAVYDAFNGGWFEVGGTSVSSPSLASIVNRSNNRLGSVYLTPIVGGADWFNNEENNLLYSQLATFTAYKANFYDVKTGSNGTTAVASWDYCTGVGSPRGTAGK